MSDPILTPEQESLVREALGDGSDWPKMFGDPIVNWKVDCLVCEKVPYDRHFYEEEAKKYRQKLGQL